MLELVIALVTRIVAEMTLLTLFYLVDFLFFAALGDVMANARHPLPLPVTGRHQFSEPHLGLANQIGRKQIHALRLSEAQPQ